MGGLEKGRGGRGQRRRSSGDSFILILFDVEML